MEAFIAVYLKHSHTTQHNIDKTREFRPKLHTKRAEMMLYFTCYQGPFGLAYFRVYIKQLMQINKFLCIIYKFLRLFMEKQFMKIRFSLVRAYKLK